MQEPCRSCDEKHKDFGGCRCQAFLFNADAASTDPVCSKSLHRDRVDAVIASAAVAAEHVDEKPLVFRNSRNSKNYL
jgi:pyrroloquinoline quinone biosynthesis protein E